jgi:hypothetical protein
MFLDHKIARCVGIAANIAGSLLGAAGLATDEGTMPFGLLGALAFFAIAAGSSTWDAGSAGR